MTIFRNGIAIELTDAEVNQIYRTRKLQLLYEDARYYLEQYDNREGTNLLEDAEENNDIDYLVDQFQEKTYYREDPFMGLWDDIITEYAEDNA